MSAEGSSISVHAARTALNRDPQIRAWAEEWLKEREREVFMASPQAKAEEFERHWRYMRPEKMHEGAVAAVEAYYAQQQQGAAENGTTMGR